VVSTQVVSVANTPHGFCLTVGETPLGDLSYEMSFAGAPGLKRIGLQCA